MNKDVIYIDVEDDITAIIGKVKASKDKVVALVPPKRIGVLQSAVNLQLLNRAAKQGDKHLALVTNNQSLIALASSAGIPVAKNLQSKPELAEIPALEVDEGEDVIEGATLPVGEHAKQGNAPAEDEKELKGAVMAAALADAPKGDELPKKPKVKSGAKVPNFNRFRKRLVLIIGGVILLIAFLIWAIFIAPRATVVVSAKTTSSSINQPVTIDTTVSSDPEKGTLKAVTKEISEEKSVEFTATGRKDAGKKATGTVEFSTSSLGGLGTIPAGTRLTTSGGLVFITDSAVTLGFQGGPSSSGTTTVTAAENGSKYNAATGNLDGAPSDVSATLTGPTSGGLTKMVTVISAEDVQKAKESVAEEDTDAIKDSLRQEFDGAAIIIDESFTIDYDEVNTSPAVGQEASTATLTTEVTYKLYGVEKTELNNYLKEYLNDELEGTDGQRIYESGAEDASFQEAEKAKNGAKATLIATAQIGPNIEDSEVKEQARGQRFGDIQQSLEAIQGVESVDVNFFPFWVNTVPDDPSRITVEFKLNESN